jgi:hypothetical protein
MSIDDERGDSSSYAEIFFATPELVLYLCHALDDDEDLLVLSQVSKSLNTHALHTFFIFHGVTLPQLTSGGGGEFPLSSQSLPAFRLAIFILSLKITKLTCIFDATTAKGDIHNLTRVLSRIPPIPDSDAAVRFGPVLG